MELLGMKEKPLSTTELLLFHSPAFRVAIQTALTALRFPHVIKPLRDLLVQWVDMILRQLPHTTEEASRWKLLSLYRSLSTTSKSGVLISREQRELFIREISRLQREWPARWSWDWTNKTLAENKMACFVGLVHLPTSTFHPKLFHTLESLPNIRKWYPEPSRNSLIVMGRYSHEEFETHFQEKWDEPQPENADNSLSVLFPSCHVLTIITFLST